VPPFIRANQQRKKNYDLGQKDRDEIEDVHFKIQKAIQSELGGNKEIHQWRITQIQDLTSPILEKGSVDMIKEAVSRARLTKTSRTPQLPLTALTITILTFLSRSIEIRRPALARTILPYRSAIPPELRRSRREGTTWRRGSGSQRQSQVHGYVGRDVNASDEREYQEGL